MLPPLMSRIASWRSLAASCALAALAGLAPVANAGFVTINEAAMDTIFSQGSFGSDTVDIRFNPVQTIHNTALLVIDADLDAELFQLSAISGPGPTVGMFFVDSISYCGSRTSNTVGCSFTPSNAVVLNSSFAAMASIGANLASHELGHALGLFHRSDATNLMNSHITSATTVLLADQVNTILNSGLVQFDASTQQHFISITPYQVLADLASNVPEPGTLLMAAVGAAFVCGASRRPRRPQ